MPRAIEWFCEQRSWNLRATTQNIDRIIGHREIVRADPTLFVRIENSD
jgi:hypothetical protein